MSNCITAAFTGVGDVVHDNNIRIYPSPTSGILYIEGVGTGAKIELADIYGRAVRSYLLTATTAVDMSGLAAGVYIIKVGNMVVGKVVKE